MKKGLALGVLALCFAAQASACFADVFTKGTIYEDTIVPITTGTGITSNKMGEATCKNVLNVVQWGQCGINEAMRNANIKNIHHADVKRDGSFVFKKVTTRVYGD